MKLILLLIGLIVFNFTNALAGESSRGSYTTAVFDFQSRGDLGTGDTSSITDILFGFLAMHPDMNLVDRTEMAKLLDEATLNLSGMVNPQQAIQVGQLTGAQIIVTGNIFVYDEKTMVTAKIIGTETSRVLAASVRGEKGEDLVALLEKLGAQIGNVIAERGHELVAAKVSRESEVAALRKALGKGKKPTVRVDIDERHIGRNTIDPAAETEMIFYLIGAGFTVLDASSLAGKGADVLITGEGISEFALRRQDIVSVKARLEIKAIDNDTGEIIAVDRQVKVEVDVTENIAAKRALQSASASIAKRLLPRLVGAQRK
jgi:TolB-like protein